MNTERIEDGDHYFSMPPKSVRHASIVPEGALADLIKTARLSELAQLEAWLALWPATSSQGLRDYIAERKDAIERGE